MTTLALLLAGVLALLTTQVVLTARPLGEVVPDPRLPNVSAPPVRMAPES